MRTVRRRTARDLAGVLRGWPGLHALDLDAEDVAEAALSVILGPPATGRTESPALRALAEVWHVETSVAAVMAFGAATRAAAAEQQSEGGPDDS